MNNSHFTTLALLLVSILAPGFSVLSKPISWEDHTADLLWDSDSCKQKSQAIDRLAGNLQQYSLRSFGTAPGESYYPLGQIRFTMPPMNIIRSPSAVAGEVWKIVFETFQPELNRTSTNEKLQTLLFERVLGRDSDTDVEELWRVNRAFIVAYEHFYNPDDEPPRISIEHKTRIDVAVHVLMTLRRQLVDVLFFEKMSPNEEALDIFSGYLENTISALHLSPCTEAWEERLIVDILRSLSIVIQPVAILFRKTLVREHE